MDGRVQEQRPTVNGGPAGLDTDIEAARRAGGTANRQYGTAVEPDAAFPINDQGTVGDAARKPLKDGKHTTARALAPDLLRGLLMVLMALDHTVVALKPWNHGQGRVSEADGGLVREWNYPIAYTIRTLTHLCAPGFTFLLGMGVVYFGRSRARLGWTALQMVRHFAIRAAVLTLITVLMGLAFSAGRIWFLNVVLFALAIDYLLAGLLWLTFHRSEPTLARAIMFCLPEDSDEDVAQPLLTDSSGPSVTRREARASSISWHIHNGLLLVLAGVTIWWNVWLSPAHGHCQAQGVESDMLSAPENAALWIWFHAVQSHRIISVFPPLAWVSFAILGLLYGRLVLARSWPPTTIRLTTLVSALAFGLLFVLTRVFHFGNLSEGCLQTAEQTGYHSMNQYLSSPASFFYLVKYPPDVAFFAFTMAVNLLLLALFDIIPSQLAKRCSVLIAYGTSALFFYLVHQVVLFSGGALLIYWFGHEVDAKDPMTDQPAIGVESLWAFFGLWAVALLVLYPLCQWYSRFKGGKSANSIWRFF